MFAQGLLREGRFVIGKISTAFNSSDLGTKYLEKTDFQGAMMFMKFEVDTEEALEVWKICEGAEGENRFGVATVESTMLEKADSGFVEAVYYQLIATFCFAMFAVVFATSFYLGYEMGQYQSRPDEKKETKQLPATVRGKDSVVRQRLTVARPAPMENCSVCTMIYADDFTINAIRERCSKHRLDTSGSKSDMIRCLRTAELPAEEARQAPRQAEQLAEEAAEVAAQAGGPAEAPAEAPDAAREGEASARASCAEALEALEGGGASEARADCLRALSAVPRSPAEEVPGQPEALAQDAAEGEASARASCAEALEALEGGGASEARADCLRALSAMPLHGLEQPADEASARASCAEALEALEGGGASEAQADCLRALAAVPEPLVDEATQAVTAGDGRAECLQALGAALSSTESEEPEAKALCLAALLAASPPLVEAKPEELSEEPAAMKEVNREAEAADQQPLSLPAASEINDHQDEVRSTHTADSLDDQAVERLTADFLPAAAVRPGSSSAATSKEADTSGIHSVLTAAEMEERIVAVVGGLSELDLEEPSAQAEKKSKGDEAAKRRIDKDTGDKKKGSKDAGLSREDLEGGAEAGRRRRGVERR
ncbi:unnamed protein product [Prorocentrum cordatum]|uniref:SAP domain-containing protein n=1 Tax=Prorocentrum cordatum TaxID=2364126 RepID=A0ABN9UWD2_9DINO|nr:unnamed protein product [Polarella glacialis]